MAGFPVASALPSLGQMPQANADFEGVIGSLANPYLANQQMQEQQQQLASLGQGINGTPEGYSAAGQRLLAAGDVKGAQGFFALGEQARERSASSAAIQSSPLSRPPMQQPYQPGPMSSAGGQEPRGVRNNNPGNIEAGAFTQGIPGYQGSDGRFAKFETPEQGILAADRLLQSYANRGLNTVAGIVNRWAPPSENDTGAYAAQVAREIGVDPNQPIDMQNPEIRQRIIAAKIRVENGKQPYGQDVFQRAYAQQAQPAPQPVQVASLGGVPQMPGAQAPQQGAQQPAPQVVAQGVPIPQAQPQQAPQRPPQIPAELRPDLTDQDLIGVLANPQLASQHTVAKYLLDQRQKFREDTGSVRTLTNPQDRAQYGVPPDYTGPVQVDRAGRLTFPGRANTVVNNTVDVKGEQEYSKTIGKALGERMDAVSKEGDTARADNILIGQLRDLGGKITNMGAGAALQGKLAEFGIKVGDNVSEIEVYKAIVDKLTPQQRAPGSGNMSDKDVAIFKSALPNLVTTPDGNKTILDTLQAITDDKSARAAIADRALAGELKPQDAIKELRALPDPLARFKEARKVGDKPASTTASPAAPSAAPPAVTTPEAYQAMPPGTRYQAPDGSIRTKK